VARDVSLYEQVDNRHESLIMGHMAMVKRVAVHLKARIPPFMELDELIQVGMVGLIEAARSFDPTKGHEFEHYALSRVRGAILDEVRRQSFLPRSAVAFNKNENEAVHVLGAASAGMLMTSSLTTSIEKVSKRLAWPRSR
jgi:RNA polymerase sigma factor for flagellar operon FliA